MVPLCCFDIALIAIIEDSKLKLPPYEWLWRCSEGGSTGKKALSAIDIDHDVEPVRFVRGGRNSAQRCRVLFHRLNVLPGFSLPILVWTRTCCGFHCDMHY